MERTATTMLRIGTWCVNPASSEISRDGETARVEVRTMRLLLCLAEHAGEVVSIDDLLSQVWPGVIVTQDSVYQAVASLRRLLGDDTRQPIYIETVPRLGYRMVATVSLWSDAQHSSDASSAQTAITPAPDRGPSRVRTGSTGTGLLWIVGAALCAVMGLAVWVVALHGHRTATLAAQAQRSVAVLPFLDLTEGMKQGEFADGMTEELIDKLSKVPDLRVPSPTSSFYFRDKQMPVAEIARTLGVAYVLDGSVRKSGDRVRVDARLVRADSGYVVWSESYDRPFDDLLMVQDDIAGEVTKALKASIEANPNQ